MSPGPAGSASMPGKFPATCFLRAMGEGFSTNRSILELFYKVKEVK